MTELRKGLALAAVSGAMLTGTATAAEVTAISTGRTDHQLIYEVIEDGLAALGYENGEMLTGNYPAIHLAIGQGDAHYTAVHWKPLHDDFYNNSGGDDALVRAGPMYTNAMQGYFIDINTADAHGISELEQMKEDAVKSLFDTDGDGLANLTGCNPGWGCEKVIEHHLDAYELRDHVNNDKGEYFALMADTIERYKAGQPIFYTTWAPNWIMGVLQEGRDVVFLNAPFSSLPGNPDADTAWPDGRNPGFGANDNFILVNKDFAESNPKAMAFFSGLRIPIGDLSAMMLRMNDGEKEPHQIEQIAEDWIAANQVDWDALIAKAMTAE
ncbi:MAG: glycine betaine/L-proline ABC transporter substrate-binding protein ProX [Boseongicola sp.]|nr:glycine betaine/L-proline ABC transporter substrate-binding protein ProX [Boseongicola sp.]MDE0694212.1 glycine betaine/L-proline ABC transporter substrate-binding protein ProX [Boseongicola sp.]